MLKFNPTTPISFYVKQSKYIPGEGHSTVWNKIITNGYETFWAQWKGGFGDRAISAQALGVNDMATIKTFFNPIIYENMRTKQVIVVKNADNTVFINNEIDKNNPNVYEVWGSPDNVNEENQFIEFKVRRYEAI